MNRAFQNKCGSTLGKLLLVTCIDIPNKIASHTCFVTDTAFPWMCNNQNPVREISKVFFLFFSFFPKRKQLLVLLSHQPNPVFPPSSAACTACEPQQDVRCANGSLGIAARPGHFQTVAKFLSPSPCKHNYCH